MSKKDKNKQKKKNWKKITSVILCCLLVFAVAGIITYKKFLEPIINQKIDTVIKTIEKVSNNEASQKKIDSVVQSMIDDGVITEESIPQYMKLKEENEAQWNEQRILEQVKKVEQEKEKASGETHEKQEQTDEKIPAQNKEEAPEKKPATPTPAPTATPKTEAASGGDLRSRMKAAMTASEFAFATYMYGKIDLGYAQSLYATDKAAAKQYIYSRVSASEISRALEIYAKYAYLVG